MNEPTIIQWLTQNASPLSIAIAALLLLREEGRRNAAALRQVIDEYRQSIAELSQAIHSAIRCLEASHRQTPPKE